MFVTLTLGSYGSIVPGAGTPTVPSSYDYRRAAVEALHFPKLFDRWMQNLRRCAGFRVQYFGAIEPQRRLAPHIHLAIRGAIPRRVIRTVSKATYLQLGWPSLEAPVYTDPDTMPAWNPTTQRVEDAAGVALPSWVEALDELDGDPAARPAVVMRFGSQVDIQGIIAPSEHANRAIRYLTKYLTKTVAETYTDPARYVWEPVPTSEAQYATTVLLSIKQAQRWRSEYETAKRQVAHRTPRRTRRARWRACGQPFGNHSPAASRHQPPKVA